MADALIPLEPDKIYHIYNHAVGKDNLFDSDADYKWFLNKIKKYILPVSEVLSYCLMPNHFHFVVKIKSEQEVKMILNKNLKGNFTLDDLIKKNENYLSDFISKQYSNFFNAYAKYYNYFKNRQGTLFKRAFRRKLITYKDYLQQLICYIHQNPVKAGFCKNLCDWKFSSYNAILSYSITLVCREEVIALFDDSANFIFCNNRMIDLELD